MTRGLDFDKRFKELNSDAVSYKGTLDFSGLGVEDQNMEQIAEFLKKNKEITGLTLMWCKVTDKGLDTLIEALPNCGIKKLNLVDNKVTANGLNNLIKAILNLPVDRSRGFDINLAGNKIDQKESQTSLSEANDANIAINLKSQMLPPTAVRVSGVSKSKSTSTTTTPQL